MRYERSGCIFQLPINVAHMKTMMDKHLHALYLLSYNDYVLHAKLLPNNFAHPHTQYSSLDILVFLSVIPSPLHII